MSSSGDEVDDHDRLIRQLAEAERSEYDKMCVPDQAIYLTSRSRGSDHRQAKADIYAAWC